jgi:hypothetical protein
VRQPLKKRTTWQRKISHCQDNLLLKLVGAAGAVLLLALFWWIDRSSLLIADLSPLRGYTSPSKLADRDSTAGDHFLAMASAGSIDLAS